MKDDNTIFIELIQDQQLRFFLEYLMTYCNGYRESATSDRLAVTLKVDPETIRSWVRRLREMGFPVCSTGKGYYYAATVMDVKRTVHWLGNMIKSISKTRLLMIKAAMQHFKPWELGDLFESDDTI